MREGIEHPKLTKPGKILGFITVAMFKRSWSILLVATFLFASLFSIWWFAPKTPSVLEAKHDNQNHECIERQEDTYINWLVGIRHSSTCRGQKFEKIKSSEGAAQSAKKSTDNLKKHTLTTTDADLLAQERVAYWTTWIGLFTAAGLGALIWTLILTRQANMSAQEAVRVTRTAGEQSTRAYVTVEKVFVTRINDPILDTSFQVTAGFEALNSGQTPAFDLEILTMFRWMTETEIRNEKVEKTPTSKGVLGPGSTRSIMQVMNTYATVSEMESYKSSGKTLWIKGRLQYRDIHGQYWQHHFCWFFRDPSRIGESVDGDNPDGKVMQFGMSAFIEGNTLTRIEKPKVEKAEETNHNASADDAD